MKIYRYLQKEEKEVFLENIVKIIKHKNIHFNFY